MTIRRSRHFDVDVERQFRWYLLETELEPADALELATRFADAGERPLEFLSQNPGAGRPRFKAHCVLSGTRSWRVNKPFSRFILFYRVEDGLLLIERLLEGHSEEAAV